MTGSLAQSEHFDMEVTELDYCNIDFVVRWEEKSQVAGVDDFAGID